MWEYKSYIYAISRTSPALENHLNVLGKDGWELVNVAADTKGYGRCVFKRPLDISKP